MSAARAMCGWPTVRISSVAKLTHYSGDDGMPIASLRLTPDGRTAVYARGSETNDKGEVADPTSNVNKPEQQSVGG